jgi:hypothetical protein
MQTHEMQLSVDQIVEETSDWPADAVADLVDRILRAKYGEADPSVDKAWQDETRRRIADMESFTPTPAQRSANAPIRIGLLAPNSRQGR